MPLKKVGVELVAEDSAKFTAALQGADKAVGSFGDVATSVGKDVGRFGDVATKAGQDVGRAGKAAEDAGRDVDRFGSAATGASKDTETFGKATDRADDALGDLDKAADKAGDEVKKLGKSVDDTGERFSKFGDVATGALREVGAMSVNVMADAGKALVGFGMDTVKVAADFESGMNRFSSVTGDAIADAGLSLDDFQDKFLELGASTQFSAAEAQDAAINLAKGGVAVADIMGDATQATLDLAAAGELELGPAAEIVAKQLGVWGKTGVKAADVSNLLAQAANASTVDVDELALGLANVGGVAQVAGVEFDDLVQTMALIAPGFSSAADAGTSLKTMISRLQPTTKPATEAMIDLGLATEDGTSKFYDAQGSFIGMEAAAQLLKTATEGLSEADKTMALQTIFGSDAVRAAAAVAEAGATGFTNMGLAMDGAGTAAAQAAERNKGFGFALDSLKGSFETIQIVVGSAVLPALTSLIDGALIPGANALLEFASTGTLTTETLDSLILGINSVIPGFGDVVLMIGENLNPILAGLGAVIASVVIPAIVSMVIAAAPLILTIGAIGLAGATLYTAWTENWGGIATTLTDFWTNTAQPVLSDVVTWVGTNVPIAVETLAGFWNDTLLPALTAVWGFIDGSVLPIFAAVYDDVATNLPAGIQVVSDFWNNTLLPAMTAAWAFIDQNILPIFANIYTEVATNLPRGIQVVSDFWNDTLLPALTAVWAFIDAYVIPIMTTLVTGTFENVNTALTTLAGFWNDTLLPAITSVYTFVSDKIVPLFVAIVDVHIAAFNLALDALAGMWTETLQPALSDVWSFIKDNVIPIFSDVETKGLTPVQTASQVLADLWNNTVYPALKSVGDFVGGSLTSAFSGLGSAIDTVTGWLSDLKRNIESITLPDWMTPGSPMPLEIAYRGLGAAINAVADTSLPKLQQELGISLTPTIGSDLAIQPTERSFFAPEQQIRPAATGAQMMMQALPNAMTTNNTFNLTAQYQQQERGSLMQDVRTMQLLFG